MSHLAYLLSRAEVKLIITWHSDIVKQNKLKRLYDPFILKLLKKADKIIVTSPPYLESSPYLLRFKKKCRIIPLGIDLTRFTINERIQKKVNEIKKTINNRIVLFVGRLTYYKGLEYLIEAMQDVSACLIIIGNGYLEKKLIQMARDYKIYNKVLFLPDISNEELVVYYHACDVFVLPSIARSEAFGVVQLEAMACFKPVISTELESGVPWVNQNGKTGIVVPPGKSGALSTAIKTLLDNQDLNHSLGRNGRERIEREFTKEQVAGKMIDLYHEILINK